MGFHFRRAYGSYYLGIRKTRFPALLRYFEHRSILAKRIKEGRKMKRERDTFSEPNQIQEHLREAERIKELKEADLKVGHSYIHSLDFARDVGEEIGKKVRKVAKKVDKILFKPS